MTTIGTTPEIQYISRNSKYYHEKVKPNEQKRNEEKERILIGCMELLAGPGILRTHLGRHGAGSEDCPRRKAALASYPIACLVPPSTPDRRQGHARQP